MRSVLALMLMISVGCKKHPEPLPASTDLLVVSPGAPPLRALRYAAAKNTKTTLELAMEGKIEAGTITSASPGLVITAELAVTDVLADGRMKLASTIVDLATHGADDQPGTPHVTAEAAVLKGLTITATLSPDGQLTDVHANVDDSKLPDATRAELASVVNSFQQIAMPLPTAPVGVGAIWRSARAFTPDNSLALTSTTSVEVTAVTATTFAYRLTAEVHGADQTVVQQGVSIDVKNITGTGAGSGTIDLAKLSMTGTLGAELHMDMTTGSDRTPMVMSTTLSTTPR